MVVGGEPGFGEAVAPEPAVSMPSVTQASMPSARTPAHHVEHAVEGRAVLHLAPGGAHAEARGAGLACDPCLGEHVLDVEQGLALEAGLLGVMGGLRAICAVLGTGAGLDREQARELHLAVSMVTAMHRSRLIDQVEQREGKQAEDLPARPIVAELMRGFRLARALRPLGLGVDRVQGFEDV